MLLSLLDPLFSRISVSFSLLMLVHLLFMGIMLAKDGQSPVISVSEMNQQNIISGTYLISHVFCYLFIKDYGNSINYY